MSFRTKAIGDLLPTPSAVPRAVRQDEGLGPGLSKCGGRPACKAAHGDGNTRSGSLEQISARQHWAVLLAFEDSACWRMRPRGSGRCERGMIFVLESYDCWPRVSLEVSAQCISPSATARSTAPGASCVAVESWLQS